MWGIDVRYCQASKSMIFLVVQKVLLNDVLAFSEKEKRKCYWGTLCRSTLGEPAEAGQVALPLRHSGRTLLGKSIQVKLTFSTLLATLADFS